MDQSPDLRLATDTFLDRLHRVSSPQFELPTPCGDWDVAALINHVAAGSAMAVALVEGCSTEEAATIMRTQVEGDLLAVHQTAEARSGQIIVARIADEVTVKRLQRYENHIELLPAHPDFEPIIVRPGEDGFAIEGLVVGLIRDGLAGAP